MAAQTTTSSKHAWRDATACVCIIYAESDCVCVLFNIVCIFLENSSSFSLCVHYRSRNPPNSGQLCANRYWFDIKEASPDNKIMHEDTLSSLLANAKILVFIPCSTPSLCAFSGARSPFAMMLFVNLTLDKKWSFVQKGTRSPSRRRRWRRPRTLTAPVRFLGPGRRAAGRAESRACVPAPSSMDAMMVQ